MARNKGSANGSWVPIEVVNIGTEQAPIYAFAVRNDELSTTIADGKVKIENDVTFPTGNDTIAKDKTFSDIISGGRLKVSPDATEITDGYGWEVENTPQGEIRTITPIRLVGSQFVGTTVDENFWTTSLGTNGTATQADGVLTLSTGTTANNTTSITSVRTARYIGGSSNRFRGNIFLDTGTADNIRRFGMYDANNGAFFELNGTSMKIVTRKATTDTAVAQASWNINSSSFSLDANLHTYEIYITNKSVWFVIDDILVHKVTGTSATPLGSLQLPVKAENNNTNGVTTNKSIVLANMVIHRLGPDETEVTWKNISSANTFVLKRAPGRLHRVIVNGAGVADKTLILYDATSATNPIATIDLNKANLATLEFGLPFHNGLTAVTNGTVDLTVVYE